MGDAAGGGGFSGSSAATSGAEYNGSNTFGGFNYKSQSGLSSTTLMIVGAAVVFGLLVLKK